MGKQLFRPKNKVLKNISWMMISKIISIISSLLASIVVTRYLGVESKGELANITAIATFFSFFSTFGLSDILIKKFAENKSKSRITAWSAIPLFMIGGVLAFAFAILSAVFLRSDKCTVRLVTIYAACYLFQFCRMFEYWFYSQAEAELCAIAELCMRIVFLILRIAGVIMKFDLVWFVYCASCENIGVCLILFLLYKIKSVQFVGKGQFSIDCFYEIIRLCLPVLVMGFATSIYMKVDQIMVGKMLSSSDLGIYSVGVTLAEYWYFIPTVIYTSFLPFLTEKHFIKDSFIENLQKFADIMVAISFFAVIGFLVFGRTIITIVYGTEFIQSAEVLNIYIWVGIFTCISFVGQAYYIINNNTKIIMYINVAGAGLNFLLNYFLIPLMGIYGAAIATLIEYIVVTFIQMPFFWKRYKELYIIELKSFLPFKRIKKLMIDMLKGR